MTSVVPPQQQHQQVFCKLTGVHALATTRWNKYRQLSPDRHTELFAGLATYQPAPQVHAALSLSPTDAESFESVVVLTPFLSSANNTSDDADICLSNLEEGGEQKPAEVELDSIVAEQLDPWGDLPSDIIDKYLAQGLARVKVFKDIRPGRGATRGGHQFYNTKEGVYIGVDNTTNLVVWSAAYNIFKAVNPGISDHELWILLRNSATNSSDVVDQSPWIHGQTQGSYSTTACLWEESWWRDIMRKKELTPDEHEKAWIGEKGLWAFTCPESFPIKQAYELSATTKAPIISSSSSPSTIANEDSPRSSLEELPLDIFFLLSTHLPVSSLLHLTTSISRKLSGLLQPHLDSLVHASTHAQQPWLLPKTAQANAHTFVPEVRQQAGFPWLAYRRACMQSPNMRCRERVWDLAVQLGRRHLQLADAKPGTNC